MESPCVSAIDSGDIAKFERICAFDLSNERAHPSHVREYESMEEYCALFRSADIDVVETSQAPMNEWSFPLIDLAMRTLSRLGLVTADDVVNAYNEFPLPVACLHRSSASLTISCVTAIVQ